MKKVQLGLLAVALFGAVAAFAQSKDVKNGWYTPEGTSFPDAPTQCSEIPDATCALHFTNDMQDGELYVRQQN